MKLEVVLKPCPWCKKTPDMQMPTWDDTWKWTIRCANTMCGVQPESKHVSVRNTSKTLLSRFVQKVDQLASNWNQGNDYKAFEKKVIDLSKIEKNFIDIKAG